MARAIRAALSGLGLFLCVGPSISCGEGEPLVVAEEAVRVVALRSLRAGVEPSILACDADETCRALAVGDAVGNAEVRVAPGSTAVIELPSGAKVSLSSEAHVGGLGTDSITVRAGAVAVEAERPVGFPALSAHGHRVAIDPARPIALVVTSDGEDATVTVHRGAAVVSGGEGNRRLGKGQSLELAGASVRPVFGPPEALPELEIARGPEGALRGLGRMTARVPGRTEVVGGVSLSHHEVRVDVRDGIATTTVEEVFQNESDRVLEGRFVFPIPAAASVSRLALWVGDELVEGEMVERKRAAAIFRGIVDDTVRPRDPALLEWTQGSELSLKIFPIEAKKSRRVLLTYEEPVAELAGRGRYVYPFSAGEDRATAIGKLTMTLRLEGADVFDVATPSHEAAIANERGGTTVAFHAEGFTPDRDFVLTWRKPRRETAEAAVDAAASVFQLRAPVALSEGDAVPASRGASRVLVLDASRSQSTGTLATQASLVRAIVGAMEEGDRFAVLACDSACTSYPEDGLATASAEMNEALGTWLGRLAPRGSSDLAGALVAGARRLPQTDGAQLVVLGDGSPTSGELSADSIVSRVRPALSREADVRFVGLGRTVDEVVLRGVADGLGATYERLDPSAAPSRRVAEIVLGLSQPTVRDLVVELPSGATLAAAAPGAARLGDELHLAGAGRIAPGETVRIHGRVGTQPFERALAVTVSPSRDGVAARAFARARIDALTRLGGEVHDTEIVDLSRRFFVMSRKTSLLVLENDTMFRSFGIERTRGKASATREPSVRMGGEAPPVVPLTEAPTNPWAAIGSATEELSAKGSMWGDSIGDAFGSGGLGLSGIGEGGGGKGEGGGGRGEGIGLGSIGTIGKAAGTGTGQGFGDGSGRLQGSAKSAAPQVRMGASSVSGRLPPEVIQRIVRRNFGRFRLCYEKGLRENPTLAGRVLVRFVIASDGSVMNATGSGDLPDKGVAACVASAFRGLTFPQPEGGSVTVSFPISFSPGEGGAAVAVVRPSGSWSSHPFGIAPPKIVHQSSDDRWMTEGEEQLATLRRRLEEDTSKRSSHVALVRGLVARGRFAEAVSRARNLTEIDPDSSVALDLFAQASLAAGDRGAALGALDGLAELAPRSVAVHRRVARGLEAAGDERRACAHWRSLSSLDPRDDEGRVESLRCRARSLGERDEVARELEGANAPDQALQGLLAAVRVGGIPAHAPKKAWSVVSASVTCDAGACPDVATIDASGQVTASILPNERGEPGARGRAGVVRTILVGALPVAKAKVTVTFEGTSRSADVEGRRTAFLTHESQ